MGKLRRASVRVNVDNATVAMPGVDDYLHDILACLEGIERTLDAMRDAIEAREPSEDIGPVLEALRAALGAKLWPRHRISRR